MPKVLFSTSTKDKSVLFMFNSETAFKNFYVAFLNSEVTVKINFKKREIEVFED